MTELTNDRAVVNWLGCIAIAAIVVAGAMSQLGGDTTVIVALIGIASMCAGSLGTRRTRNDPAPDTTQPPPWTGIVADHDRLS